MIVERAYYVGRKSLLCGKKEPTVWEEWRKSKRLEQRQKAEIGWGCGVLGVLAFKPG